MNFWPFIAAAGVGIGVIAFFAWLIARKERKTKDNEWEDDSKFKQGREGTTRYRYKK